MMNFPPYSIFPTLIGDKITLRNIQPADMEGVVGISFYDAIQASTLGQAVEMQDKINRDYLNGDSIHWGIAENLTNEIVGTCGYYRGFEHGTGELGCVLLPQYQGQGYMTFAIQLAIDFGIKEIGLNHIEAITTRQNKKAISLLERLNFVKLADLEDDEIKYGYINHSS